VFRVFRGFNLVAAASCRALLAAPHLNSFTVFRGFNLDSFRVFRVFRGFNLDFFRGFD